MRLNAAPIKAIRQETGCSSGVQGAVFLFGPCKKDQRAFTMVELITIMVIIGILAAVAVPRFFDKSTFESRGFYDQAISTLRYAQKSAVAQHRFVCVSITGGDTITLTQGVSNACGGNLVSPTGLATYTLTAPSGVTLNNTAFYFDALGKPSATQSISVSGYSSAITVEAETGYVH